jgi:hypothetical protein
MRSFRNGSLRLIAGAIAVAVGIALSGCRLPGDDQGLIPSGISVRNAADVTLYFKVFTPERTYSLPTVVRPRDRAIVLSRGEFAPAIAENECTIVDLVAFDENENEVARHPPPLFALTTYG